MKPQFERETAKRVPKISSCTPGCSGRISQLMIHLDGGLVDAMRTGAPPPLSAPACWTLEERSAVVRRSNFFFILDVVYLVEALLAVDHVHRRRSRSRLLKAPRVQYVPAGIINLFALMTIFPLLCPKIRVLFLVRRRPSRQ